MNAVPWSAQLRGLAARFGDAPAVTAQHGGTLSYEALSDRAHALAEVLAARGVTPGTPAPGPGFPQNSPPPTRTRVPASSTISGIAAAFTS